MMYSGVHSPESMMYSGVHSPESAVYSGVHSPESVVYSAGVHSGALEFPRKQRELLKYVLFSLSKKIENNFT
jgi:hypothetical protein